jgi:hypothetical protein
MVLMCPLAVMSWLAVQPFVVVDQVPGPRLASCAAPA